MNKVGLRVSLALAALATLVGTAQARAQDVSVGGVAYGQYEVLLSDTASHASAFDVTRAYLTVQGAFAHDVSTRVTADVHRDDAGSLGYRLKYAYVKWSPEGSPFAPKFGLIHTPWIDWEEHLYPYRFQGTVPLERAGYESSADFGAGVDFAWGGQAVNGSFAVVNGEGYGHRETGSATDVGLRVSARLLPSDDPGPAGGLRVSGYAHRGHHTDDGSRDRWLGMLSWKSRDLLLAGQYIATEDGGMDGRVLSAYGVVQLSGTPAALLARVDAHDPDADTDDDETTRVIAGVSYRFAPNLLLLADVDLLDYGREVLPPELEARRNRFLVQMEISY